MSRPPRLRVLRVLRLALARARYAAGRPGRRSRARRGDRARPRRLRGGAIGQNTRGQQRQELRRGQLRHAPCTRGSGPVAPDIRGTTLTGRKLDPGRLPRRRRGAQLLGLLVRRRAARKRRRLRRWPGTSSRAAVRFLGVDIRDSPAAAEAFERTFQISYPEPQRPGRQGRARVPEHGAAGRHPHHAGDRPYRAGSRAGSSARCPTRRWAADRQGVWRAPHDGAAMAAVSR